jgi:hypothetical protein
LNYWDVKGYSTNYLRTVMSVQCFLDGLLSSSPSTSTSSKTKDATTNDYTNDYTNEHSYEQLSIEEFKATRSSLFNLFNNEEPIIKVRDRNEDTLNAFDKRPDFMKKLVGDVVSTPHFLDKDAKAGCLAARLANFLPGLAKATSYGGPSGINWIHASDHFVCRSSHNIPYSKFSDSEKDDPNAEQTLVAMSYGVLSHLAWRFRTWYKSLPLLAAIAGPPLLDIQKQVTETAERCSNSSSRSSSSTILNGENKEKKPFIVYSCHDVTILSLLYGVGADFLATKEDLIEVGVNPGNDERWRFWPRYASTLVFELVRVDHDNDNDSDAENTSTDYNHDTNSHKLNKIRKPLKIILGSKIVVLNLRILLINYYKLMNNKTKVISSTLLFKEIVVHLLVSFEVVDKKPLNNPFLFISSLFLPSFCLV